MLLFLELWNSLEIWTLMVSLKFLTNISKLKVTHALIYSLRLLLTWISLSGAWCATGTRTVGVISKVDQAASDRRSLAAVQALLSGQGPSVTLEMPWVAMIGQSGGFMSADDTLETAWKAEMESLKSILSGVSHKKLGRIALVETLSHQIRKRMKQRLPNILSG
jgi:hypothetical protein